MSCRYKFGDKVIIKNYPGVITSIYQRTDNPGFICTVTFDNKNLIPNKMDFKEEEIKYSSEHNIGSKNNTKTTCTCGTTVTYGRVPVESHSEYCDLKTNKNTRLNTSFKGKTKPPGSISNTQIDSSYSDLMDQFEQMLGTDDDEDDFGFYGI